MKKLKNNKKGFTLIELLAVIVILAILIAVAVPAVMRYLESSRKNTFASNAEQAISAVRTDVAYTGPNYTTIYYDVDNINKLLDKKLNSSPYGGTYTGYIKVTKPTTGGVYTYSICLVDSNGNGIFDQEEKDVTGNNVTVDSTKTCVIPTGSYVATTDEAGLNITTYNIK